MSWDIFPKSKIQYFLEKLKTKLDLKVDKETGKGLSTNDFDNTYKGKVDKIDTSTSSASGNPISISGLKSDQLAIDPIITFEPIQAGSGTPSPSNIRAISGYDKVEVFSCGKNLFDGTYSKTGYYLTTDGIEHSGTFSLTQYIPVKANTAYYFKNLVPYSVTASLCWYNKAKEYISGETLSNGFTKTSPANACYVKASIRDGQTDICINEGNSAITYEPYKSATSISESLGQTVYWGECDLRSGKFKALGKMVDMGTLDYSYHATSSGVKIYATASLSDMLPTAGTHPFICECYDSVQARGADFTISKYNQYAENSNLYVNDSRYSADAAGAAALKVALSGVKLVYQLATPFTIQLTPHEISLLKDYAYVSTNGTNIQLSYHLGEMASLGDVSQLGETVNSLAEDLEMEDLSSGLTPNTDVINTLNSLTVKKIGHFVWINCTFHPKAITTFQNKTIFTITDSKLMPLDANVNISGLYVPNESSASTTMPLLVAVNKSTSQIRTPNNGAFGGITNISTSSLVTFTAIYVTP